MDNLNYIVFICIIVAFAMILPLLEKKTRMVLIFMIVGVCCCLFVSEINNILLGVFDEDMLYVTTTITPSGLSVSWIQSLICCVMRSCTCSRWA